MPSDPDRGRPAYDPAATYPLVRSAVRRGWATALSELEADTVLAIDGPAILEWERLRLGVEAAAREAGRELTFGTTEPAMRSYEEIVRATSSAHLSDDPDFEMLPDIAFDALFAERPAAPEAPAAPGSPAAPGTGGGLRVIAGPGAALAEHDVLWYADLPKRFAEKAVGDGKGVNLGQRSGDGPASGRRLQYVDWPLLDRHRDEIAERVARWLDVRDPENPTHADGDALSATLAELATRPFRTRTYFNSTPWGGHWAQRELGVHTEARNTALGYELIAPESGILLGTKDCRIEIPLQVLVSRHPEKVLGKRVHRRFGTSFPVRFDYLDTVDGGSLSVHTHPQSDYMKRVFGWPYTQHESYYLMSTSEESVVFLGLRGDADLEEFAERAHRADHHGEPFDIQRYVQTFPAERHQLYLVPGGTPHGSGRGNVVLEISATPYLYSLRFYDWLRTDAEGRQRPVHVDHAFSNLNRDRRGADVARDLVQPARTLHEGDGWSEELLGRLPEMFFEVRRIVLRQEQTDGLDQEVVATIDTQDGLNVLNLVEGEHVRIEIDRPNDGAGNQAGNQTEGPITHDLVHAETIVIPASVGSYTIRTLRGAARVVRCVIREDL